MRYGDKVIVSFMKAIFETDIGLYRFDEFYYSLVRILYRKLNSFKRNISKCMCSHPTVPLYPGPTEMQTTAPILMYRPTTQPISQSTLLSGSSLGLK